MSVNAAASSAASVKPSKPSSPLLTSYLVSYNLIAAASWAYVLYLIVRHLFVDNQPIDTLFALIHLPLYFAQSLAILEIVHSALRMVSSPLVTTVLQVFSRLLLVWGIYYVVPTSRHHLGFVLATTSWSLVEVPRYLFYVVSLVATPTYAMKFVRYSLFLVLYPTGITGEVWSMVSSLPYIASSGLFKVAMPNSINFAFDYGYFIMFALASYIPGSYIMYTFMLSQRKKVLGSAATAKKTQ